MSVNVFFSGSLPLSLSSEILHMLMSMSPVNDALVSSFVHGESGDKTVLVSHAGLALCY